MTICDHVRILISTIMGISAETTILLKRVFYNYLRFFIKIDCFLPDHRKKNAKERILFYADLLFLWA